MTDTTIEAQIIAELDADPRIPNPREIAVFADRDAVTLRGTVGSFAQRRAAVNDARKADGVVDVFDELKVRLLDEYARQDAEIRGAALQALIWDIEIPVDALDVKVEDGWVTLTGYVGYQFQSDNAFDDVASLKGVIGITNEIKVIEPVL
ncbi:MAG TPA: BON domain-containing protein [Thermoleophilaceae bacterium]